MGPGCPRPPDDLGLREKEIMARREAWKDTDDPDVFVRGAAWRIFVWTCVTVVGAAIIIGGIYWVGVATSGIKGAGDQELITNSGQNRVNSQEWFESQHGQIVSADQKLDGLKAQVTASIGKPDESWHATNYVGAQNRCIDMREAYNAEARKVSRGEWRSATLPIHLSQDDSAYDCKEN
jgi:hypothetical protein